jgi:hypothetical protein
VLLGGKYVLPFRFRDERGTRTSHHLIFVSKHVRGYTIMKEIMAKESTGRDQGVPSFEYNPADKRYLLLFELSRPLDELGHMLADEFAGKTLSMAEIFNTHHVGRRYIKSNYKDALRSLEENGMVTAEPPAAKRRLRKGVRTFSDNVRVSFPKRT